MRRKWVESEFQSSKSQNYDPAESLEKDKLLKLPVKSQVKDKQNYAFFWQSA